MGVITRDEDVLFRVGDVVRCSDLVVRVVSYIDLATPGNYPVVWTNLLPWNAGGLTLLRRPVQAGDVLHHTASNADFTTSDTFIGSGWENCGWTHANGVAIEPGAEPPGIVGTTTSGTPVCRAVRVAWPGAIASISTKINYPKINPPPPMNCTRCNHRNEYLGYEHLAADGSYTCRGCK